uniref:Endonuclease/exonuclease/phosphatase domain-containing protein n=1 Tax=Fusarium oxysporum (strain Fo5176) TaxID=660025 RepID=A0A0D2YDG1_FUSOF
MEMRKPTSSIPWQTDRPWKQFFYVWSPETSRWQGIQSSQSSSDKSNLMKLAVYSWNIDFMLPHGEARMNAALKHLEELTRQHRLDNDTAVAINLQECVPLDLETIGEKDWIRDSFYCTDIDTSAWASGAYGTASLIDRRLEISSCFRVHYSATQMERDALFIDVSVLPGGQKVSLVPSLQAISTPFSHLTGLSTQTTTLKMHTWNSAAKRAMEGVLIMGHIRGGNKLYLSFVYYMAVHAWIKCFSVATASDFKDLRDLVLMWNQTKKKKKFERNCFLLGLKGRGLPTILA